MLTQTLTPTVAELAPLIGTWRMDAVFPDGRQGPPEDTRARTVFEYGPESQFVIQRWEVPHPAAPDGIAIIIADRERNALLQHYFDSRGTARLYAMTFDGRTWTLQRTKADFSPLDFHQRFVGTISDDGATIDAQWQSSADGQQWTRDFGLTYTRIGNVR